MPADNIACSSTFPAIDLRIDSPADTVAVRDLLGTLFQADFMQDLPDDQRGTAELVLAEVMNNIVEHAYSNGPGSIDLRIVRDLAGLECCITDHGRPMPGRALPSGHLPGTEGELPEGGFGWFLIRNLTRDLHYRRDGSGNRLSFRLDAEQS